MLALHHIFLLPARICCNLVSVSGQVRADEVPEHRVVEVVVPLGPFFEGFLLASFAGEIRALKGVERLLVDGLLPLVLKNVEAVNRT